MPLLLIVFVAAAEPRCPDGETWDAPMQMCMAKNDFADSNRGHYDAMTSQQDCDGYFHFGMSMCLPKPETFGRFSAMVMSNIFAVASGETGRRGLQNITAPDWLMVNAGIDLATWNRLELDTMLTAERWTYPAAGYPELLQIGETNGAGVPYVDAQHPHSSPIMGLDIADVISFSDTSRRVLRIFFAPRGESTDGPIAFMHRASGTVNPDAPLGHHIGEDAGHVSSTVIGASFFVGDTTLEASTFYGREPSPTAVDLPIGAPDSFALRVAEYFSPHASAALSYASVYNPEGDTTKPRVDRLSASAYLRWFAPHGFRSQTTLIWGGVTHYDHTVFLNAFTAESAFYDKANTFFSRVEVLQRTPAELLIPSSHDDAPQWVGALSVGYTRVVFNWEMFDFSIGGEAEGIAVPGDFAAAYGSPVEFTLRAFAEVRMLAMFQRALASRARGGDAPATQPAR